MLSCAYAWPEMYQRKLELPTPATYHLAAKHELHKRFGAVTAQTGKRVAVSRKKLRAPATNCGYPQVISLKTANER